MTALEDTVDELDTLADHLELTARTPLGTGVHSPDAGVMYDAATLMRTASGELTAQAEFRLLVQRVLLSVDAKLLAAVLSSASDR